MNEQKTEQTVNPYAVMTLGALQGFKHIYSGTADPGKVAKRRAKNRVARKSRRTNRLNQKG